MAINLAFTISRSLSSEAESPESGRLLCEADGYLFSISEHILVHLFWLRLKEVVRWKRRWPRRQGWREQGGV